MVVSAQGKSLFFYGLKKMYLVRKMILKKISFSRYLWIKLNIFQ